MPDSFSAAITTAQNILGGPAGWIIFLLAVCTGFVRLALSVQKLIASERDADLKRKTIALKKLPAWQQRHVIRD